MSKIKSVSTYDGSEWGAAVPLGADDINIDITNATTNPSDSVSTIASLDNTDVIVGSGDTNADAWTKFNRFRKRVANNLNQYIRGSITTIYNASNGSDTTVYSTNAINNRINTISNPNLLDNWYFVRGSGSVGAYGSFPVNQRGQASYSGAAGFTIDRLNKASSKGTVYSIAQGLQFSTSDDNYAYFSFFGQDVPSWMTASYSVLTNLGITTIRTGGSPVTLPSGILVYIDSNSRRLALRIPGNLSQSNSETFIAAKVEVGGTQTLAHQENGTWVLNEIPDWKEEYRKCNGSVIVQDRSITSGTTPSSDIYGKSYYLNDSNDFNIATWQLTSLANGREGFQLVAGKKVNNVNKFNYLRMHVDANGDPIVEVNGAAAWRKALGLCYAVNESYQTTASICLSGITDSASKTLYFTLPIPKSMENISTVTVTSLNGWIAGPIGALNSSAANVQFVGASGYTSSAVKLSNYAVRIALTKSTAFTNSVNSSCVTYFGHVSVKFT